jgi:hypothetical protein
MGRRPNYIKIEKEGYKAYTGTRVQDVHRPTRPGKRPQKVQESREKTTTGTTKRGYPAKED